MKMKARNEIVIVLLALFVFALMIKAVAAIPGGPNSITVEKSEAGNLSNVGAKQVNAEAGNVTQLTINASILTTSWQGYYGNITGVITLTDGSGQTMYDWSGGTDFSPVGEIYAGNSSVTSWSDVVCVNLNGDGVPGQDGVNATVLEDYYGMSSTDTDGISETFQGTNDITIGTTTLNSCPATNTYVNNASQSTKFNETLLTENATGTVIFATQVENDETGYDGSPWDFQMIVGENGAAGTTPYYFYVELV